MKKEIITALITGVIGAVGGSAMTYTATTNNNNTNNNTNNSTIIINRDGEQIEVSADDYEKLEADNKKLQKENDSLEKSLKNNQAKSEQANLESTDFIDTLHDGEAHEVSLSANNDDSFMIGGKSYTDAFMLYGYNGFALFNLEENYSKVEFDVGRIDESDISNAEVKIYLDGKLSGNYSINAEQTLTHLDIDLAGTQDLKIAIQSEDYVKYGFVNIKAEKE